MNPREFCAEPGFRDTVLLTYSFDALFFERMPLRDLWKGDSAAVTVVADSRQLDESAARWSGQARSLGADYILGAASIRGAFHPKLILRVGRKGAIAWVGSGNLTFAGWGGNQEVSTCWKIGPGASDPGAWLSDLIGDVSSWCSGRLERESLASIRQLDWIETAARQPTIQSPVLWSHPSQALAPQLATRWRGRRFTRLLAMTGSTDGEGAFLRWAGETFGVETAVIAATPARVSFELAALERLDIEVSFVPIENRLLHAKFYWFDGPAGAAAVMGSANCSAAAWLLAPSGGGNVELVTVYDAPNIHEFQPLLSLFDVEGRTPSDVLSSIPRPVESTETSTEVPHHLSSVTWDSDTKTLQCVVDSLPNPPDSVVIRLGERGIDMSLERTATRSTHWYAHVADLDEPDAAEFARAVILTGAGDFETNEHWVDRLTLLSYASKRRNVAVPLEGLAKSQTTSAQRRLLDEIQVLATSILGNDSDNQGLYGHPSTSRLELPNKTAESASPVDPDKLIISLGDIVDPTRAAFGKADAAPISLWGVATAIFGPDVISPGGDGGEATTSPNVDDEADANPDMPPEAPPPIGPLPALPDEKLRERLVSEVDAFLSRFEKQDFLTKLDAHRLCQATAFPLAIIVLGTRGGWVGQTVAVRWCGRVVSLVLGRKGRNGLLFKVRAVYESAAKLAEFNTIVGDGTLWVSLLGALGGLDWNVLYGHPEKADVFRMIFRERQLLASAKPGQLAYLVSKLNVPNGVRLITEIAPQASRALDQLEDYLLSVWETLRQAQDARGIVHRRKDMLWSPGSGWATVLATSPDDAGENIRVRFGGRDAKFPQHRYHLNVTQALEQDPELAELWQTVCLAVAVRAGDAALTA